MFYFSPFVNGIRHSNRMTPTIPTMIPMIILLQTIVRHIPIPRVSAPTIPSRTVPIIFPDSLTGLLFQNVYLFADTIENNIKFGKPDADHEQVVAAAKKACCHDFISALPDGYDTVIGEGGATLSGGEKQRISIARAMLKNAPIIIFDEATANVDPENEDKLQKAMEALMRDKTILMIAHRLKTVQKADQILVLNEGQIVQKGTHEELKDTPGIYRDFLEVRKEAAGWKL